LPSSLFLIIHIIFFNPVPSPSHLLFFSPRLTLSLRLTFTYDPAALTELIYSPVSVLVWLFNFLFLLFPSPFFMDKVPSNPFLKGNLEYKDLALWPFCYSCQHFLETYCILKNFIHPPAGTLHFLYHYLSPLSIIFLRIF